MKLLKFILPIVALFLLYVIITPKATIGEETKNSVQDSVVTISFCMVGDLMCHSVQFEYAQVKKDSFNFKPVYRYVKSYIESVDFAMGNLETVLGGGKKFSGFPFFNSPDAYLEALKYSGFDLLMTSNNHCLDQKKEGLLRTIDRLNEKKIHYVGTFNSQRDRDSIRIYNIKGLTFAVLAYTFSTNGIPLPSGAPYTVNMLEEKLLVSDLKRAKEKNPDIVIVYFHWGDEYQRYPNAYQKKFMKVSVDNGADIILGSHPHVLQPVDFYATKNANLDTGIVAYSLGNFVSNQRKRYTDSGTILNFSITKDVAKDSVYLSDVSFIPTYVFKGNTSNGREYIILPSEIATKDTLPEFLSKGDRTYIKQCFNDTKDIITAYNKKIILQSIK
ncbi:MAG: CapA family protein [Ignavibacteriales bacterium]|nr:CapA family protein [Ignavibacteriales bacterium]